MEGRERNLNVETRRERKQKAVTKFLADRSREFLDKDVGVRFGEVLQDKW